MFKRSLPKLPVLLALLFFGAICFYSLMNTPLLSAPIQNYIESKDLSTFTSEVQAAYVSDNLKQKDFLLSLNGLYARLTNRHLYNNVILLNNGYLTNAQSALYNLSRLANTTALFASYTEDVLQTPYLYVQAGMNLDLDKSLLPAGAIFTNYENGDNLLAAMEKAGVSCLNLRPYLNATVEQTEQYYFRTDHHWNFTGALAATGHIMQAIDQLLPDYELDMTYADPNLWEPHLLKDHFLGSNGKRVGPWYAGVDDIVYYTPTFDTQMSCAISPNNLFYKGSFADANIRKNYISRADYMHTSPYGLYIGGDRALVNHRNPTAPNDLKILIIKDSFTLPVQAFLSTMFREVDVIDPRHYTDVAHLTEYLHSHSYDLILQLQSVVSITNSSYLSFILHIPPSPPVFLTAADVPMLSVHANDNNHYAKNLPVTLKPGTTYTLHIQKANLLEGNCSGFTVRLYDSAAQKPLKSAVFDLEYGNQTDGFTWVFTVPETGHTALVLQFFAGISGKTAENAIDFESIRLLEHSET